MRVWATESEVVSPERSEPRSGRYAGCALATFRNAEYGRERCQKAHPAKAALTEERGEERILFRDFLFREPFYLMREDNPFVPDVAVEVVGL